LRSYVHQPELFILDEATAMVDSQTEQLIQTALKKILHNRTAIINCPSFIYHTNGTSNCSNASRKKLLEKGTHEELLQLNGHYAQIYEAQFDYLNY
jgi:ABC-type multidrug transport system fused ATPase/permease subunit